LGGWKIKRNIDGQDKAEYTLDKACVLKAGGKIKVKLLAAFKLFLSILTPTIAITINKSVKSNPNARCSSINEPGWMSVAVL